MHCLVIPQREEKHYKVRKGREIHAAKEKTNLGYLRRRYSVVDKKVEVYMNSSQLGVRGVVDEVLFLEDGSGAPLDYKFAEYKDKLFRTHRYQSALYGMMISEIFGIPVNRGYIVYTRSENKIIEIEFTEKDREKASELVYNVFHIVQEGVYPSVHTNKWKCLNCTYRRICTQ
jgi:CRISPR-associated exonuclease Cas4